MEMYKTEHGFLLEQLIGWTDKESSPPEDRLGVIGEISIDIEGIVYTIREVEMSKGIFTGIEYNVDQGDIGPVLANVPKALQRKDGDSIFDLVIQYMLGVDKDELKLTKGLPARSNTVDLDEASSLLKKDEKKYEGLLLCPIDSLNFTQRTQNLLHGDKIYNIGTLVQRTELAILKILGLGLKARKEIQEKLALAKLTLDIVLPDNLKESIKAENKKLYKEHQK